MLNTPFTSWPLFSQEEANAVSDVLLSNRVNYWTGQEGRLFEQEYAEFSNCEYAIAVTNGTVAIDLAFKALGLGKGDEVIVTSRTYLASVSSIVTTGATPIFTDIDIDSQNITANSIKKVITPRTKAIICVHLAGWPCDMDDIIALASKQDIYVVEDCAQAHGAKYKGKSVGLSARTK
jgi:dTDP-4-amino-4,6-dideoxygalactose transaminase